MARLRELGEFELVIPSELMILPAMLTKSEGGLAVVAERFEGSTAKLAEVASEEPAELADGLDADEAALDNALGTP